MTTSYDEHDHPFQPQVHYFVGGAIGAVNPALTAMANAPRVGDHLLDRLG